MTDGQKLLRIGQALMGVAILIAGVTLVIDSIQDGDDIKKGVGMLMVWAVLGKQINGSPR